jgi:MurNAc alpha-1-phosphate uridylyltransferase
MLPVAIVAGGLATRLRPQTSRVPKALLSIAGRPFIFHQLELLKRQHIERVVLCVGHLGEQIEEAVGDGRSQGLMVDYSYDGSELLGTGGAVRRATPLLGDQFFVLYGDSYTPCSFAPIQRAYEDSGRPALMTVLRNENRWDHSNVLFADGALIEYDKHSPRADMLHIDYGLSIFSRDAFSAYEGRTVLDLADVCADLSRSGRLAGFEVTERFYEIGSPQGIAETEVFLRQRAESQ